MPRLHGQHQVSVHLEEDLMSLRGRILVWLFEKHDTLPTPNPYLGSKVMQRKNYYIYSGFHPEELLLMTFWNNIQKLFS